MWNTIYKCCEVCPSSTFAFAGDISCTCCPSIELLPDCLPIGR